MEIKIPQKGTRYKGNKGHLGQDVCTTKGYYTECDETQLWTMVTASQKNLFKNYFKKICLGKGPKR